MTDKCSLCEGTKIDPVLGGPCTWCDGTGDANGIAKAVADTITHGIGVMKVSAKGAEHVPLADILVNLKPFRSLPYGTRFRYQGTKDVWVRTSHNIVAEWPGRLRTPTNEPIQSLCSFCHLDGDEDGNTLDTLVEVVDQDAELAALREELAMTQGLLDASSESNLEWRRKLTAAEQRNSTLTTLLREGLEESAPEDDWIDRVIEVLRDQPTESGASE